MQNGLSDAWIEALFIGSTEYIADHGGEGAGSCTGMYENLLGRVPNQAEVNQWLADINAGLSTITVAYDFAAGAKREDHRLMADYKTYPNRVPSQTEINGWVGDFVLGLSNEDVSAGFLGGSEYSGDHGGSTNAWLDAAYVDAFGVPSDLEAYDDWMLVLSS